jgi:DNA-binding response OmpR family regulator
MGPRNTVCVVADDDAQMRNLIRQALAEKGYRIVEAANGKEAVRHVTESDARMIVLDIVMPDCEGLETITELKSHHPATRILAISGGGHSGDGQSYLEQASLLGADDTLLKPFELDDLVAKVDALAVH